MDEMPTADALVVVDVQRAFVSGAEAVPPHLRLQAAVALLLEQARRAGVSVVFIQNDGMPGALDEPHTPGWELHFPPLPGEHVVRKSEDDGFDGTGLDELLAASGRRHHRHLRHAVGNVPGGDGPNRDGDRLWRDPAA